jgi:acyl carrier protein
MQNLSAFEIEIARQLIDSLNLEVTLDEIDPNAPLYQEGLGLDSIDLLELSVVLSKRYGIQIKSDDPDITRIFSSLRALAETVQSRKTA